MRRLDSVDAQFLGIEDGRTHAHVCQLTIIEGKDADGAPVTAQTIRDLIAQRIHLMPPFRWRVKEVPFGLDYPVFVDDAQFDLDSHIWELALPAPGDAKQLGELVGRLASRPLDRSRPLWEAHVIGGLADGHVAMLTKLHHAAVDGISGMEMLSILLDDSPTVREIEAPAEQPTTNEPGDLELLARAVAGLPRQPLRMVRALPATLRHIDQLPGMRTIPGAKYVSGVADWAARAATRNRDGRQLERTPVRAPRASISGRITAHRRFAYGSLPLGTVKTIKNSTPGLTLNDVVVALCAGALRRRLAARGDEVDGPLVAMVPFTVRTGADREYGNRISSMIVAIPTDEPDPRQRLARARTR